MASVFHRLQEVPDDYPISLQVNQALTGFGDAVCVPVIVWISENILNSLVMLVQENPLCFVANSRLPPIYDTGAYE